QSGQGQTVDVALYEAMFNLLEAVVPEYSGAGVVRQPSGTTVTGIVPTNTYRCGDGKYVVIGGNGDSIFKRLMEGIGHPDLAADKRLANNAGRVEHEDEIDQIIGGWCSARSSTEVLAVMAQQRVPAGPIYNVEDMLADEHFQARGLFEQVEIDGEPLKIPAILPKLGRTPGKTEWPGPKLGEHSEEVLTGLGLSAAEIDALRRAGVS
ncbi:MAG: CoA transferase, partial [Cellvibrionaceae bacterium]|nr:CoA transferase [Cellvibrionaceae bacterium]